MKRRKTKRGKTFEELGIYPFAYTKIGRAWWLTASPAVLPFQVPLFYFTKLKEVIFYTRLFNSVVAEFHAASSKTIHGYLSTPTRRRKNQK